MVMGMWVRKRNKELGNTHEGTAAPARTAHKKIECRMPKSPCHSEIQTRALRLEPALPIKK
jgi:hypothetical protein